MIIRPHISHPEKVEIEKRLAELRLADAKATAELAETTHNGAETWHDNAGFDAAKDKKNLAELSLNKLGRLLARAKVVEPKGGKVEIGTRVSYRDEETGDELNIQIAGDAAGLMDAKWASYQAPLGKLLLGKKVGAVCKGRIGERVVELTVLEIH